MKQYEGPSLTASAVTHIVLGVDIKCATHEVVNMGVVDNQ